MTRSPVALLKAKSVSKLKTIALSEGHEPRVVTAALEAVRSGLANIILVGSRPDVERELETQGGTVNAQIQIMDPAASEHHEGFAKSLFEIRKHKGMTETQAAKLVRQPMQFSAMLVREGFADGTVGGAITASAAVILPALQIIGKAKEAPIVSSFFIMLPPEAASQNGRAMLYADCGFVVDPSSEEMAAIASTTARSAQVFLEEPVRIAMLSYSTNGSAKHTKVDKVSKATELLKREHPELKVDGEMQFDAAFDPQTGKRKSPESEVAGVANVMVFPSLNAGNIAYKITERIGGYTAIGPILQGLAKPANDLSRGCSANDIVEIIAVTVLQALEGETT